MEMENDTFYKQSLFDKVTTKEARNDEDNCFSSCFVGLEEVGGSLYTKQNIMQYKKNRR